MVTALWGTCNGANIVFNRNESGRWETAVPASLSGSYLLSLWARDAAGNVGYFATVKYAFDTSRMCMTVTILEVGAAFTVEEVQALLGSDLTTQSSLREFSAVMLPDTLLSQVVRCEVCHERKTI